MASNQDFINQVAPFAVQTMRETKVLASLTIAQACLETGYGVSRLSSEYNNFFGIKGSGDAGSVTLPTTEYKNGQPVKVDASFAKYSTPKGSFDRRAQLFLNGVSWDKNKYRNLIGVTDYRLACRLIQKDGYATDPAYADKLIKIIETYNLGSYDKQALTPPPVHKEEKGVYIVKAGDSLSKILGTSDPQKIHDVAQRNGIADPNRIFIDQKIYLDAVPASHVTAAAAPKTYIVKSGDTLSEILGTNDPDRIHEVCQKNGIHDPSKIFIGQHIQL
jgi:LysM repeat protein